MKSKLIFVSALAVAAGAAQAQSFSGVGVANATVQPAGPRAGANGTNFLNVEGSALGTFASFGVIDFSASSFGAPANVNVTKAVLKLTESNAAFTTPATLRFYGASDTTTSISNVAGASPLKYIAGGANFGVGTQLGSLVDFGTGQFTTTGNVNSGQVDSFTLNLTSGGGNYLKSALATGTGLIRLVVVSETASGAATFAGVTNSTAARRPVLQLDTQPVPEPASMLALGLGVTALLRRRKA